MGVVVDFFFLPVPGAVHGLECKDIFFHGEGEHVVAIVLPVARCLPQFAVINVWGGHFLKSSSPVLLLKTMTKMSNKIKSPACLHRYLTELSSWRAHSFKENHNHETKFRGKSLSYPDELCESVVDVGTTGHEEAAARTQIMEEKQLLILWHKHRKIHISALIRNIKYM